MKYLLDTMVWLWSVGPSEKIGKAGLKIVSSGEEDVYLSVASCWEVAIKTRLGKFDLPEPPVTYVPTRLTAQGINPLSVSLEHSLKVYDLPLHHHDTFDRLIIAQAIAEEMTILTSDRIFARYPVDVVWCGN
jgi:PIN domain nuclease of toxin-antitoxin system